MKMPKLLDCTLRDGSYALNFQFTRRDTENICRALDRAKVDYIEVGHGLGLGASSAKYGIAFETDETYLAAAASNVKNCKWGAFFIPKIGSKVDLFNSIDAGMNFVRLGCEVKDWSKILDYAYISKKAGLEVFANLMKTYSVSPREFGVVAQQISDSGVFDAVYVVDSAGCMIPSEVKNYVSAVKDRCEIEVGFHGHNNLDLANANCIAALEAGAIFVDGSIRGIGRSAGNAQTEVLAYLINKFTSSSNLDPFSLMELGEKVINPINLSSQGIPSLDVVIGMAKFHTAHLNRFKRFSEQMNVDLRKLILEVSCMDCVNPSDDLIKTVASDLRRRA